MTDLASLCTRLGIDEAAARTALESASAYQPAPWYVQAILGFGAWISALLMIVFVALFLNLVVGLNEPNLGTAAIGAAMFAAGLLLQRRGRNGAFAEQFAIALAAAGAAVAAGSIGIELDDLWPAAIAAVALTAIDVWQGRHPQQQFLLATLSVVLVIAALNDTDLAYRVDLAAFAVPVGVCLFLWPARRNLRPLATVLLLTMPIDALVNDATFGLGDAPGGWGARALAALCIVALLWLRGRMRNAPGSPFALAVVALLAAAICLILPPGGSTALVILVLAYALGDRALAIVGVLLQLYFLPRFYYDLELSLLTKSRLLMAVGFLLLMAYGIVACRRKAGAA